MNNRTIFGVVAGSFAAGMGAVIAYRLPADSLSAIAAMALTALILIAVMTIVMAIFGWVVVKITQRPPHDGDGSGRVGAPTYPPVMIFGQSAAQPVLSPERNGYQEMLPAGRRDFTIIGDDGNDDE